ncbi:MAG: type II toxin-antitoxin system HicA family toxin [Candidatus Poribacteria bacterium]|nr:type II toxin-antitoxin system HicA family toxin [Candidatus Poribacteria bacterium]
MKRRQLIKHLRENGCEFIREGGKHSWWGNPERGTRAAVPRHNEINNITAQKICKELGIPRL